MRLSDLLKKKGTIQEIKGNNITNSTITMVSNDSCVMAYNDKCTVIKLNSKTYRIPKNSDVNICVTNGNIYVDNKKLSSRELKKYLVD